MDEFPAAAARRPTGIEAIQEGAMPEQPADPIHYDMKIPPEPKNREEESDSTKKHGDKINTGTESNDTDPQPEEKKGA